ncbi:MAG: hypothetical protein D3906_18155 [Candidatus Electrothrix sp. AUS1_2]|nr:hypothetical protein [Candidatus Electrothrix sp. AUS1_2]
MLFGDHSSYGEHLASYELLPETASDISFYRNQNFTGLFIADFAISETKFLRWSRSLELQPEVIGEPQTIADAWAFSRGNTAGHHIIEHGLYVSRRRENGGGVDLAYNRDNRRGYISKSHN